MDREEKEGDLRWFFLEDLIFPSSTSRESPADCDPSLRPGNNFYENQNPRVQTHPTSQSQNYLTQNFSCESPPTAAASVSFQDSISDYRFDVISHLRDTTLFCDMIPPEYHASFGSSETGTELNPGLDETTHEQGLETLLSRLNLSNPPPTSQFGLEDAWSGVDSMRGNINSYDSITASGLAPSTYAQERQYSLRTTMQERIWQMMRIQTALRGQTGYCTSPRGVPLSSYNISNEFDWQCGRQSLGTMNYDYPFRSSSSPKGIRLDSKFQTRERFGNDDWISFQPPQRPPTSSLLEELNRQQLISETEDRRGYPLSQRIGEWEDHLHKLMVHPSYHYQVQKRLEESNEEEVTEILNGLIRNALKLARTCTDNHGSRSVQKLLKHLKTPVQIFFAISALRDITLTLAKSPSGQFVIRKCFQLFSAKDNEQILNEIAENCLEIATDKVGCCVMQDCVNYADEETRERLVNRIVAYAPFLSQHSYGNFVVQYVLSMGRPEVAEELLANLKGRFLMLSMNKHGSHVVEKFLRGYEEEKYSSRIIEELISGDPERSLNLFQDRWGNYVAQTAKKVAKGLTREALMSLINSYKPFLENHPHGKCVLMASASGRKKHHRVQSIIIHY
ncbi:hypothetical protein F2P56_036809 [Juglans regia]|uniref:PUM-HD domain-containing protein n=2 Tax=Juglans regia TaxID=51240 RepID=A0A833WD06_JUGRE|nr:hypothetical protein F2P56_036809 [Juglans regia]